MENVRNRIDVQLISHKKDYLKGISKPSYMSQKVFDNDLIAIRKSKVISIPNKPAYLGMCILYFEQSIYIEYGNEYGK